MSLRKPRRAIALLAIMGVVGVFALASPFGSNAGAQPTQAPHLGLTVDMNDDGSAATVTVVLDPGSEIVAAFDGVISYNPDHATPTGCEELTGFGACNPENAGLVRFASASADKWSETSNVVALNFTVTEPSDIGVSIGTMYNAANEEITDATASDAVTLGELPAPVGSGAITGTILAGDTALFGTQVCAESSQTNVSVCADVDSRGSYRIEGLATGSYTVTARHYSGDYAPLALTDIAVVSPNLTQAVDGVLLTADAADQASDDDESQGSTPSPTPGPSAGVSGVSGTVTNGSGDPVPAALFFVEDPAIGQPSCSGTGFDGTYNIGGLLGGNYVASVTDPGGRYADQTGPSFGLNSDGQRTGVDFTLTAG